MRILHTSDWHVTEGPRFDRVLAALDRMVSIGEGEEVDLWVIAGDLFHTDLPHRAPTPRELVAVGERIRQMSVSAPVVIVYGNHDVEQALAPLAWTACTHPVRVVDRPEITMVREGVPVLCLPYPQKRHFIAARGPGAVEGQRQEAGQSIELLLRGLLAGASVPLAVAHINVAGARTGGGEVLIGREIEIAPAVLAELPVGYWALGHIHQEQDMGPTAGYCGTPVQQNFGDSARVGFRIVEINESGGDLKFVPLGDGELVTVEAWWEPVGPDAFKWVLDFAGGAAAAAAAVEMKVVGHCRESERDVATLAGLEAQARADFPAVPSIRCQRIIEPETRAARGEVVAQARTVMDKVEAYWSTLSPGPDADERAAALALLDELEHAAP